MLKNNFIRLLILGVLVAIIGYTVFSTDTNSGQNNYEKKLIEDRTGKDEAFRTGEHSPIEDKATFTGLKYFQPNQMYKLTAEILPYEGDDRQASVPMTDGSVETYEKYGFVSFKLNDKTFKLLIYKHENILSVLFKDATAAQETYGGGRYIDIPIENVKNGNEIELDFNTAYNPYCAYNHTYACPLPPKENTLPIRIEAGEKNY